MLYSMKYQDRTGDDLGKRGINFFAGSTPSFGFGFHNKGFKNEIEISILKSIF